MSRKQGYSLKTIQTKLDSVEIQLPVLIPRSVIIIADTVYFGRNFGVMVFRDWLEKKNLYWKFVKYETVQEYQLGIEHLVGLGFEILGIVVDGRRGLFKAFGNVPVQMCHFHQKQIVTKYLTRNPRIEAGQELKETYILDRTATFLSNSCW